MGASPSPATRARIAQTSSFRTATGDGRIGHVDVRDVAAGAAEIAVSPAAHAGKTYWPTGPESLSGNDVAEIFTKVLGRLITFHPISFEEQQQAMIERVLMLGVDDRRQPMTARFVAHIPVGDPGQTAAGDARTLCAACAALSRSPFACTWRQIARLYLVARRCVNAAGWPWSRAGEQPLSCVIQQLG